MAEDLPAFRKRVSSWLTNLGIGCVVLFLTSGLVGTLGASGAAWLVAGLFAVAASICFGTLLLGTRP